VRGLGVLKPQQQLENLIDWLGKTLDALSEEEVKS
jgi:transcription-repair coupling factor (superfamily II helicase)